MSVVESVLEVRLLFCSHASIYALGLLDMQWLLTSYSVKRWVLTKHISNTIIIILLEYSPKALKALVWKNIRSPCNPLTCKLLLEAAQKFSGRAVYVGRELKQWWVPRLGPLHLQFR